MNYAKYNRSFIMMEEQSREFALRDMPVKGHVKVETGNNKGALRCTVQNLRYYGKGGYVYKLILFGKKKERTIHAIIGNLVINKNGNGETYFRFNPRDIDGKGNEYDDFTVAIVAAASTSDGKEPLHPVLKGTIRAEENSFRGEEQDQIMAARVRDQVEEQEEPEPEEEEAAAPNQTQEQVANHTRTQEPVLNQPQKIPNQGQSQGRTPNQPQPQERQTNRGPQPEKSHCQATYNSFYNDCLVRFCAHTCRVAGYYEDVKPFSQDRTGARWKKMNNVSSLPIVSPGAQHFATQYAHYLFGAKPDDSGYAVKYYIAVPGRNLKEEQPDGGESGFRLWQPAGGEQAKSAYGYWIVAIDAVTGDIEEA